MIKANELRIGNWIRVFGGYAKVKLIPSELPIEPIPLTPEILEKCGFVEDRGNYWVDLMTHYLELINKLQGWFPVYAQTPELSSEAEQRVLLNRIDYLHQLQNLFFALTGTELNIDL